MKTLYLSDLDGTLLGDDSKLSAYSRDALNRMIKDGLLFSYATGRAYHKAMRVVGEVDFRIPAVVYNGVFVTEPDGKILLENDFGEEAEALFHEILAKGLNPIVYTRIDGKERFCFYDGELNEGLTRFLDGRRREDNRGMPVLKKEALFRGKPFFFLCIDEEEKLRELHESIKNRFHSVLERDFYAKQFVLEITPKNASKSASALWLKNYLGCERLVVFGDGGNDLDLFRAADEAYAVDAAVNELKAAARAVIGNNGEDAVVRFIEQEFYKKV